MAVNEDNDQTPVTHDPVTHDPKGRRFVTTRDGQEASVEYRLGDGEMSITHTLVPEAIGGRGIAGELVRAAMDHARAQGLKVVPQCSYAVGWLDRHPEYAELRA